MNLQQELSSLWNARSLVWVLTRREIASRHAGTAAGILWPYLQPLLSIAAYYLVFDIVFAMRLQAGSSTHAVGTFLVVGALPWMAFCDAISRGMSSLIENGSLLQKNPLPPVLFATRAVFASAAIFGPLLVVVAFAYAPLHGFELPLLAMVPLLTAQLILCVLLGYLLAILAAALRDMVQMVSFLLSVGIYLTPILFPIHMFPAEWQWALWLNPMTGLVVGYQHVLLEGQWPPASTWLALLAWFAVIAVVLDIAVRRSRDQLVDWL